MRPSERIPSTMRVEKIRQINYADLTATDTFQNFEVSLPAGRFLAGFAVRVNEAFSHVAGDLRLDGDLGDLEIPLFANVALESVGKHFCPLRSYDEAQNNFPADGYNFNLIVTSSSGNVADREAQGQVDIFAVYHLLVVPVDPLTIAACTATEGAIYVSFSERIQESFSDLGAWSLEGTDATIDDYGTIDGEGFIEFSCTGDPTGGYLIYQPMGDPWLSLSGGQLGPQRILIEPD